MSYWSGPGSQMPCVAVVQPAHLQLALAEPHLERHDSRVYVLEWLQKYIRNHFTPT
jgi:hypothetical protein